MRQIMITGASGFVGNQLCSCLCSKPFQVIACTRSKIVSQYPNQTIVPVGNISANTDWKNALLNVDVVIHLAGFAHQPSGDDKSLGLLWETNVKATQSLANQAAEAGVKRFVFVSSIKAMGESTNTDSPYIADGATAPEDDYGKSKLEAERVLIDIGKRAGMEVVIIRPVLVYGPGVKANFKSLYNYICKGYPLPFGKLHNRRSFVSVYNLVDLIRVCIDHPNAANQSFLVSDGISISSADLVRKIADGCDVPVRLLNVPSWLLRCLGFMTGRSDTIARLCGNLEVDISKTEMLLDWKPAYSMEYTLAKMRKTQDGFME